MKVNGRSNYKPGPKDECGTPCYAVVSILNAIELHRLQLGIPKRHFIILEPAVGLTEYRHVGIVEGLQFLGYNVYSLYNRDFLSLDYEDIQQSAKHYYGAKIRMVITNPPFSVALKRRFIQKCQEWYEEHDLPYALLMGSTTLVEKRNGKTLRGCALHIPHGRICYNMPNKGWGTEKEPTKATFETNWYSKGLTDPFSIWYSDFDVSDHFDALKRFYIEFEKKPNF